VDGDAALSVNVVGILRPTSPRIAFSHWPVACTLLVLALLIWGCLAHLERYITPQRGVGYWLGIAGGSMMVLSLLYSARKRIPGLQRLGSIPTWFNVHMFLGVVGPVLILFHTTFHLGATNSNVALFTMVLVAVSGVLGRYIYTRLHAALDARVRTLAKPQNRGARGRSGRDRVAHLPGLLDTLDRLEMRLSPPPKDTVAATLHLCKACYRVPVAKWIARRAVDRAVRVAVSTGDPILRNPRRMVVFARCYAYRGLRAARGVEDIQTYTMLFSWWHILHFPLFFMLLIAGIVHVIAISIY
jgi:hypothetical protein